MTKTFGISKQLLRKVPSRKSLRRRRRRRMLGIELLERRRMLATVEWVFDGDGFWDVGSNWSTGQAPQPGDDVVIDRPAGNYTITHRSGTSQINSLAGSERLVVSGGVLEVAGSVQIDNDFLLSGGTIRSATILLGAGGQPLQATSSGGTLDGVTLDDGDADAANVVLDASRSGTIRVTVRNGLSLDNGSRAILSYDDAIFFEGTQTLGGTGGEVDFIGNARFSGLGGVGSRAFMRSAA